MIILDDLLFSCEHHNDGSYGFILNNQLDIKLDELVPEIEFKNIKIYYGGPVHSQSILFTSVRDLIENLVKYVITFGPVVILIRLLNSLI